MVGTERPFSAGHVGVVAPIAPLHGGEKLIQRGYGKLQTVRFSGSPCCQSAILWKQPTVMSKFNPPSSDKKAECREIAQRSDCKTVDIQLGDPVRAQFMVLNVSPIVKVGVNM